MLDEDTPYVRVLVLFHGLLKVFFMFSLLFVVPALIAMELALARNSKYYNERHYHLTRMWGWVCYCNMVFMLFQSMFHNLFNDWWVSPIDGEWLFVTWLFSSAVGEARFWNEMQLMFCLGSALHVAASLMGSTNSGNEFIPRFHKRMH